METRRRKKQAEYFFDYTLLFIVLFLLGFGLIMVYSTSSYEASMTASLPCLIVQPWSLYLVFVPLAEPQFNARITAAQAYSWLWKIRAWRARGIPGQDSCSAGAP